MLQKVIDDIPNEYKDKFVTFLDEAPIPLEQLQDSLKNYLETVRMVAPLVRAFNMDTMERLGIVGLQLLDIATSDTQKKLAQAACRYLIVEEMDDEVTGVLGLDDDVQVINAVCRAFEREDLVIPLSRG